MASLGSPTLDCFRNGSVVQLKSKISGKTLTLEEGGHVHSNGSVGYYAGCLGPRTPVWGRWTDGTYHRGTISNVDMQVHIKFNDGDQVSHDAHDQTAVVADVNPDPEVVQVGSRVIAQFRGSAKYYPGRIIKVDRANPKCPMCDIQFDDGDKDSADVNQMRMLPDVSASSLEAPTIALNSRVLGRWTNNTYYRGRVTNVGGKIDVQFDDGDKTEHDPSDVSAVIYDVNPRPGTIQVGTRVVGFWPNGNKFFLGKVTQVDYMNPQSPRYFVQFDDGDQIWCNLNEIRPVPLRRESAGCVVWGRWTDNQYFHGRVTSTSGGKVHVTFDDGDSISHNMNDASSVIVDRVPNPAHVPVGSNVIAAFSGRNQFYKGKITQIDPTNFYAPRYFVRYDDGDQGWVTFDQVRLLPMRVNEVGTTVWGRWTSGDYFKGKVERVDSKIHILFNDGDRISHSPSDVTAIVLDTTPNPGLVARGSRVIADWQGKPKWYLGTVMSVDKNNPYEVRYHIFYDDGDKGWVNVNQLRLLPSPGPATKAQFSAIQIGGNVVALRSVANPQYFLGIEGGRLVGKMFDSCCHFYIHETPDQFVSLEFCMFPGQHIGVNQDGTVTPPASTPKNHQAFFEVKLLFSPYGQIYSAEHGHGGGYPAPTPGYPQPGSYPSPSGGGYPAGGYPGGYPTGSHPPPAGGYPGGYPAGPAPPPQGGYPGGYPTGTHRPPAGGYPSAPPQQYPGPGGYPGAPPQQYPGQGGYPSAPPQQYPGPGSGYPRGPAPPYPPGTQGYPH